jgi:hypothetical protein
MSWPISSIPICRRHRCCQADKSPHWVCSDQDHCLLQLQSNQSDNIHPAGITSSPSHSPTKAIAQAQEHSTILNVAAQTLPLNKSCLDKTHLAHDAPLGTAH